MKNMEGMEVPLVSWRESVGWDAIYATDKGERLIATRPILGWAVIGVTVPGRKNLLAEVRGIASIIDNEFLLVGQEKSFLGYCWHEMDALGMYGSAALAFRRRRSRAEEPRVKTS